MVHLLHFSCFNPCALNLSSCFCIHSFTWKSHCWSIGSSTCLFGRNPLVMGVVYWSGISDCALRTGHRNGWTEERPPGTELRSSRTNCLRIVGKIVRPMPNADEDSRLNAGNERSDAHTQTFTIIGKSILHTLGPLLIGTLGSRDALDPAASRGFPFYSLWIQIPKSFTIMAHFYSSTQSKNMPPWNHDKWTWRCDLDKQIRAPQEGTISKRNERTRENEADANSREASSDAPTVVATTTAFLFDFCLLLLRSSCFVVVESSILNLAPTLALNWMGDPKKRSKNVWYRKSRFSRLYLSAVPPER